MTERRRILILSNLYPPHHIGGFELGCRDVVCGLNKLGCETHVLTSDRRRTDPTGFEDESIERALAWMWKYPEEMPIRRLYRLVRRDLGVLRNAIREFRPDRVLVFNTTGIQKCLLAELAAHPIPVTTFISDHDLLPGLRKDQWFAYWASQPRNRLKRLGKRFLRSVASIAGMQPGVTANMFQNVLFTSAFLERQHRREAFAPRRSAVLHWGVNPSAIPPRPFDRPFSGRFLFAGHMRHDKGPQTVIAAAAELVRRDVRGFTVDLFGGTLDPAYVDMLHRKVKEGELAGIIRLRGELSREALAVAYAEYDVMIFPSIWDEPFSIALLEGMAGGLAILSTDTGGTPEILVDGSNARIFARGNPSGLADLMDEMLRDPGQVQRLGERARQTVLGRFTLDHMLHDLSEFLGNQEDASR
jgi:glycogen(starch) synthase